jgi:hypothetical protein
VQRMESTSLSIAGLGCRVVCRHLCRLVMFSAARSMAISVGYREFGVVVVVIVLRVLVTEDTPRERRDLGGAPRDVISKPGV